MLSWDKLLFCSSPIETSGQNEEWQGGFNQTVIYIRPVNCIFFMLARGLWPRGARRGRLAFVCHFGEVALAFDGAFGENAFALYDR